MPEISWFFILLVLVAYWLKNNNHKMFIVVSLLGIVLFLLCSTSYLPKIAINSVERKFTPIKLSQIDTSKTYYIYVLGSGVTLDPRLPASMKLSSTSLVRLVEGIRIYNYLDHVTLVTSAAIKGESISQAKLSKEAAVSLGVKEQNIQMLETPTSTLEEVEIFSDQGIKVLPAPTEYLYKAGSKSYNGMTLPSFASLELTNNYQTALLKHVYYKWFKKK
jgi:uncharacterized SAM-binding protein YcdF (DUF218 family)